MPSLGGVLKAFDTLVMLRDLARSFTSGGEAQARAGDAAGAGAGAGAGMAVDRTPRDLRSVGQLEATLTNVVVAALKEAFDRDHARLELERLQIEEQRRRAEEAMRLELRRQAAERELGRLRLLAGTALVGWIASMVMFAARGAAVSMPARVTLAVGWLLLLGALGAAFSAQRHVDAHAPDGTPTSETGWAGMAALWLLVAGLAATAVSLLL